MTNSSLCLGTRLAISQAIESLSACRHGRGREASFHSRAAVVLLSDTLRSLWGGEKVRCPVCGWRGAEFFHFPSPSGPHIRPNALCPQCGALERQRSIAHWLAEQVSPKLTLHLAPNQGLHNWIRGWSSGPVIAVDLEQHGIDARMDLHSLGFPHECFELCDQLF